MNVFHTLGDIHGRYSVGSFGFRNHYRPAAGDIGVGSIFLTCLLDDVQPNIRKTRSYGVFFDFQLPFIENPTKESK